MNKYSAQMFDITECPDEVKWDMVIDLLPNGQLFVFDELVPV